MKPDARDGRNKIRRRIEHDQLLVNQVLELASRLFNEAGRVQLEAQLEGPDGKVTAIETPALLALRAAVRALAEHRASKED